MKELIELQGKLKVSKDGTNEYQKWRYRSLEMILNKLNPILNCVKKHPTSGCFKKNGDYFFNDVLNN